METPQYQAIMRAISRLEGQNQALQEQNRELRSLMNSALNTVPITVRDEMAEFLTKFAELLENRKPSETADAIRELTGILKDLKDRLTNSELIHGEMSSQVSFAADEIRNFTQKLLNSDWMKGQQTSEVE